MIVEILILLVLVYIGLGISNLNASLSKYREDFIFSQNEIIELNRKIARDCETMDGALYNINDYLARFYGNSLPVGP